MKKPAIPLQERLENLRGTVQAGYAELRRLESEFKKRGVMIAEITRQCKDLRAWVRNIATEKVVALKDYKVVTEEEETLLGQLSRAKNEELTERASLKNVAESMRKLVGSLKVLEAEAKTSAKIYRFKRKENAVQQDGE